MFKGIEYGMLVYSMERLADGGLELEAQAWEGDSGGPGFIEVTPGVL